MLYKSRMSNVLNYKYEIFPTRPQRFQIGNVLRQARFQWNKAVGVRKKLKRSLETGQIEHVLKKCLSVPKSNEQAQRKSAIMKFKDSNADFQNLDFDSVSKLYDINTFFGSSLEKVTSKHVDIKVLEKELKEKYKIEQEQWRAAKKNGATGSGLPKRKTFWGMMSAINKYAGFAAKTFMDESFSSPKGMSLSGVRTNISGYKNSIRWNQSVSPKKGQRAFGAIGEPKFKKRADGFSYQIPQNSDIGQLVRKTKNSHWQINLKVLPEENRWVKLVYHRSIPESGKIKQITINEKAGRYFAVLSVDVPDTAWKIAPMNTGWLAGIDPGAQTALTIALKESKSDELKYLAIHYEFLEKSLDKLEKMQQSLALKTGPRRKRNEEEVKEALAKFVSKNKVKKLSDEEKGKAIAKEKGYLERTMTRQEASKRWRRWGKRISAFQFKIACRRADVLHKISRALAESCSLIGIGNWEPEREISYRKKIRAAKKKVKKGIDGAQQELDNLLAEKSKQGPKGSVRRRRSGRDRSIATLRRLIEEKAQRSGAYAMPKINEAGSTYTCCVCEKETGPKGKENISVREWRCEHCNTVHNRDLNSGFNILKKAAAQAAIPATESTVAKTMTQEPEPSHVGNNWSPGRGSSARGDISLKQYQNIELWKKDVPKSLKTLIDMGIARSFPTTGSENEQNRPDST